MIKVEVSVATIEPDMISLYGTPDASATLVTIRPGGKDTHLLQDRIVLHLNPAAADLLTDGLVKLQKQRNDLKAALAQVQSSAEGRTPPPA